MTPALVPWDAIGNDIRGMARVLRKSGYDVRVYSGWIHPELAHEAQTFDIQTDSFWRDDTTLLIYHHSTAWPAGQQVISEAGCRVVVKHHNVTPSRFFEPYSAEHTAACAAGEQMTEWLAERPGVLYWSDSQFNAEGLKGYGASPDACRVLPPFHLTEELATAPMALDVVNECRQYKGLRILFVGGLKPNKGHAGLLRALAAYRRHVDPDAVLILPGRSDPRLESYSETLRRYAAQLGVESGVVFPGPVDESRLRTWYFAADVFLCLSEHEGFCVPLIEAMHFRLPIVTHRRTAIPETVGGSALLWEPDEFESILESLIMCQERDDRYRLVTDAAWERYHAAYSTGQIEQSFLALVLEACNREPA